MKVRLGRWTRWAVVEHTVPLFPSGEVRARVVALGPLRFVWGEVK